MAVRGSKMTLNDVWNRARRRIAGRIGTWGLGSAIVATSLVLLWHHSRMIQLGYDTEALRTEKGRLERLHRELLVERESLASLGRIERLASELGLVHVALRDAVVVNVVPTSSTSDSPENFAVALGRGVLPVEAHAAP